MKINLYLPQWIIASFFFLTSIHSMAQTNKPVILNHVAVYIHDLKASTDFYKNIIGLTEIPEPFHDGKHTWFKIGEHSQLHLIEGAPSITTHDKDSHLCFSVGSIENFISILEKNKISYGNWAGENGKINLRPDGIKQIYFQDPDGYWIEINNDTF
jgi:lactoylglutathione lyase